MVALGVHEAGVQEKYLGCPIAVRGTNAFDYLVDRVEKKLNLWKSNCLSHSGRLVLIQSVINNMSIYAMGTVIIPKKVIKKLTAIARNFFWGGKHDKRSLAYVAWSSITLPKGMGGLGLRSLEEMNKALVLKNIWKLAAGCQTQWVMALEAKYYPRGAFWSTQRKTTCSKLWRQMMELRSVLINQVCWKVGTGAIHLFSQPWFPRWQSLTAVMATQRNERVAPLIDQATHTWDFNALQSHMGFSLALQLVADKSLKPTSSGAPDTLILCYAKSGKFNVRKAYQLITGNTRDVYEKQLWDWLWGKVPLISKLKLFIWRAIHAALPVRAVLSIRIRHLSPMCPLCNTHPETITHALFHCQFARAVWMGSALGIKFDGLTSSFADILKSMSLALSDQDICSFVSTAWSIWRSRNEVVFKGKRPTLGACQSFYKGTMASCQNRILLSASTVPLIGNCVGRLQQAAGISPIPLPILKYQFYVNGSWDETGKAGVGLCLTQEGSIVFWISKCTGAYTAAQSEAQAVLEGIRVVMDHANGEAIIHSDSLETIHALSSKQPQIHDWRSFTEIWQAWFLLANRQHRITLNNSDRATDGIQIAHRLANQGRVYQWDRNSSEEPVFCIEEL